MCNATQTLERAAIAEYDGHLDRADAERLAALEYDRSLPPIAQRLLIHAVELASITPGPRFWANWRAIENGMSRLDIDNQTRMTIWKAYDETWEDLNR